VVDDHSRSITLPANYATGWPVDLVLDPRDLLRADPASAGARKPDP
jgi:hypothetical protein